MLGTVYRITLEQYKGIVVSVVTLTHVLPWEQPHRA